MDPRSERRLVFLVGAVQFVNILDFMMVMPLGPDFARDLGIAESHLGWIGGAYLAAASVAGVAFTPVLDRFDRRAALLVTLGGLFAGTLAGAFAVDLGTLILARFVAGLFGGPATAVALAIVSDAIPADRRGRAMGAVMGAFSVSSVVGVPVGLELARLGGWRLPFVVVAALGGVFAAASRLFLPPLRAHLDSGRAPSSPIATLRLPGLALAAAAVGGLNLHAFVVIPNISAFYQGNLGYPRDRMGLLYLAGGVASFFTLRVAGRAVDRFGSTRVAAAATVGVVTILVGLYGLEWTLVPPMAWFVAMMVSMSTRNIAWTTLSTRVPPPEARAGFQSLLSSVQHAGAAAGSFAGSLLLTSRPGGGLDGMPTVVAGSALIAVAILPVIARLERGLR